MILVNVTSAKERRLQFLRVCVRESGCAVALTDALRNVDAPALNLLHHVFPRRH
jgi:hypothetical protein